VSLVGGIPLADVTFEDGVGLVFGSNLSRLGSVTLPISDLSSDLTVKNFSQFANITLQPNAFYAIDVFLGDESHIDQATVGWGTTAEDSGPGVEEGYNPSIITDNDFFPNKPTPSPNNGGPIFQMEVSGVATPESSTWTLMLVGLGVLDSFPVAAGPCSLRLPPDFASLSRRETCRFRTRFADVRSTARASCVVATNRHDAENY
jgi:hypothetical protein